MKGFTVLSYYDYMGNFDGTLSTWDDCEGYERNCTETDEGHADIYEYLHEDEEILIRVESYEFSEG
jgi:hypothetical protein